MAGNQPTVYSVSQVTALVRSALDEALPARMAVRGQITNWAAAASGHAYFGLKDQNALLGCVMWKSRLAAVRFRPENGLEVIATGSVDVYPPHGKYQLIADQLEPAGVGELHLAFEQMVKRLQEQGLFSERHKKPLPAYPRRIGIITSESGAAVHDIAKSIHDRWPPAKLFLYPVPVQGAGAAEAIAAAVSDVNRRNSLLRLDLVIVGRGGGSLEDLWAFNEEVVARAIFDSRIPVISAVGHEVDTTIADLVADARASTPTKAGVAAVPDAAEVMAGLGHSEAAMRTRVGWILDRCGERLRTVCASSVFRDPLLAVRTREQRLDELGPTLANCLRQLVSRASAALQLCCEKVLRIEPHGLVGARKVRLGDLAGRLAAASAKILDAGRLALSAQENRLAALDPRGVLKRGYSMTTTRAGSLVTSPSDVSVGDGIVTELAGRNFIESTVVKK
jgi:exodeoxyribonuclease VII large subunit